MDLATKEVKPAAEKETLKEELSNILVEARMALPGMQGLFGFQTIAIFNNGFAQLTVASVWLHLCALSLNALSIALMTPPAYHRLSHPGEVTRTIVRRYSRLISAAMIPLAASLAMEMYVIFSTAVDSVLAGSVAACATLLIVVSLWFAFPLTARSEKN